jgi:hypothetical protein
MKMLFGVVTCIIAAGCVGMHGQSTLDAIADQVQPSFFVEGFIEYAGPGEKWGGPATLVLHVDAKEGSAPVVSVNPALSTSRNSAEGSTTMSVTKAREQLAVLATALSSGESGFRGCMYPVRVRLIKADGGLVEKYGCRGQSGWSRAASEAMNEFLQ